MDNILLDVKNYLDITFADDLLDKKITGILERGMSYICDICGSDSINFDNEDKRVHFCLIM